MASPLAELAAPDGLRRLSRLVLLTMPALRSGWLARSGRIYAWVIAVFYAGLLVFVTTRGSADSASSVLVLSLGTISWAGGIVAYAAARDLDAEERAAGLERVLAARAVPASLRRPARLLATIAVVASAVFLPASLVNGVAIALAPSLRAAFVLAACLVLVAGYSLFFGVALGAVARSASALSRRYARFLFTLAVFGPAIAEAAVGKTASLPGAFAWLIARIGEMGAPP